MNDLKKNLTPEDLQRGGRYNWRYQPERLIYIGRKGSWYQFARVDGLAWKVWCEVLAEDLEMFEVTTGE